MSEEPSITDPEQDDATDQFRALREKAKRVDQLEKELDGLRRDKMFRDAGLDPANKQHAYFMRGYDGDPDPEKVRAEALEAGFLGAPEPAAAAAAPSVEVPAAEQEAWARVDGVSGETPAPQTPADVLAAIGATARTERWTEKRLGQEISHALAQQGLPTAMDGY